MRGRFCGTKPGAERQAAVSRLPPLRTSPPGFFTSWEEESSLRSVLPWNSLPSRKKKAQVSHWYDRWVWRAIRSQRVKTGFVVCAWLCGKSLVVLANSFLPDFGVCLRCPRAGRSMLWRRKESPARFPWNCTSRPAQCLRTQFAIIASVVVANFFCPRCGCSRFTTRDKLGDAGTGDDGQPVHRDGHPGTQEWRDHYGKQQNIGFPGQRGFFPAHQGLPGPLRAGLSSKAHPEGVEEEFEAALCAQEAPSPDEGEPAPEEPQEGPAGGV